LRNCMLPQTKILEDWTHRCVCVFEVLLTRVSTRFGRRNIENSFKTHTQRFVHLPKSSIGGEHTCHNRIRRVRISRRKIHDHPFGCYNHVTWSEISSSFHCINRLIMLPKARRRLSKKRGLVAYVCPISIRRPHDVHYKYQV
jgi:hypothetical protein